MLHLTPATHSKQSTEASARILQQEKQPTPPTQEQGCTYTPLSNHMGAAKEEIEEVFSGSFWLST